MICLIRHLSSTKLLKNGYDELPSVIETIPSANLARIKHYRNPHKHIVKLRLILLPYGHMGWFVLCKYDCIHITDLFYVSVVTFIVANLSCVSLVTFTITDLDLSCFSMVTFIVTEPDLSFVSLVSFIEIGLVWGL